MFGRGFDFRHPLSQTATLNARRSCVSKDAESHHLHTSCGPAAEQRALARKSDPLLAADQREVDGSDVRGTVPTDEPVDLRAHELEPITDSMSLGQHPKRVVTRVGS